MITIWGKEFEHEQGSYDDNEEEEKSMQIKDEIKTNLVNLGFRAMYLTIMS